MIFSFLWIRISWQLMIVCLLIICCIFFTAEKDPLQKVSTKKISMKQINCTRYKNWQCKKKKWKQKRTQWTLKWKHKTNIYKLIHTHRQTKKKINVDKSNLVVNYQITIWIVNFVSIISTFECWIVKKIYNNSIPSWNSRRNTNKQLCNRTKIKSFPFSPKQNWFS